MPTLHETIDSKRAIIFDLFHTLTGLESTWARASMTSDFLGISREKWNEQLLEKSRDRLVGILRDPFLIIEKMAHAVNPDIPNDTIKQSVKNRIARFESALVGIPNEVRTTIEQLKSRGKRIGLCSNADVMEMAGWPRSPIVHLFDSTVFSCEVGCMKPEPEIYQKSLFELGAEPSETLFVGDGGSNELQGAKSLGMTTVMITGVIQELWPDRIESRKLFADFVIEKIPELIS